MDLAKRFQRAILCIGLWLIAAGCGGNIPTDVKEVMAGPKTYVGSDTCKTCHLEHYDSWKMTLHSRMTQDVLANKDAIIAPIDEKKILFKSDKNVC